MEDNAGKKRQDGMINSRPRYSFKALPRTSTPSTPMSIKGTSSSPAPAPAPAPSLFQRSTASLAGGRSPSSTYPSSSSSSVVPTRSTSIPAAINRGSVEKEGVTDIGDSSANAATVSSRQRIEELIKEDILCQQTIGKADDKREALHTYGLALMEGLVSQRKKGEGEGEGEGVERTKTSSVPVPPPVPASLPSSASIAVPVSLPAPLFAPSPVSTPINVSTSGPLSMSAPLYGPCAYRDFLGSEEDQISDRLDLLGEQRRGR
jgi:hypothetical protein